jgi:hypothetical protein
MRASRIPVTELQGEDDEGGAAEDVEPARGLAWHGMLGRFADRPGELQPVVEPLTDPSEHQAHRVTP